MIAGNQDMIKVGKGAMNIYNGLSYAIPNMWNNSPWYAKGTLATAGAITAIPVAEYGYWYVIRHPYISTGVVGIGADILNPGVPSTMTGTIWGLYNEYKDYKNGENKTWNQLFGK